MGHEVWSKSDPALFEDVDDQLWDEDIYLAQSLHHLSAVTDEYLVDHAALSDSSDERFSCILCTVCMYRIEYSNNSNTQTILGSGCMVEVYG